MLIGGAIVATQLTDNYFPADKSHNIKKEAIKAFVTFKSKSGTTTTGTTTIHNETTTIGGSDNETNSSDVEEIPTGHSVNLDIILHERAYGEISYFGNSGELVSGDFGKKVVKTKEKKYFNVGKSAHGIIEGDKKSKVYVGGWELFDNVNVYLT